MLKRSGVKNILFLAVAIMTTALLGDSAVFGGLTGQDVVKLNPAGLSVDASGAWVEDSAAWSLADRDTFTAYAPAAAVTNILVTLPQATDLSAIKVYGSASFTLRVYEDTTGTWKLIPGLDAVSLRSQSEAWNAFKPSGAARVSRVMIETTKTSGPQTGIKEIEIWGTDPGDPRLTLDGTMTAANVKAVLAVVPRPAHILELTTAPATIDVPADGRLHQLTCNLSADPRLAKRAYLLYDAYNADYPVSPEKRINGLSWTGGFVPSSSAIPQWVSHLEEISPSWLVKGENTIAFRNQVTGRDPSSYFVRDLKILVEFENGWQTVSSVSAASPDPSHPAQVAFDGDTATYFELTSVNVLELKTSSTVQPESIKLNLWSASGSPSGRLTLQYLAGAQWKSFTTGGTIDLSTLHDGWNTVPLPEQVAADSLKLTFEVTPDARRRGATVGGLAELGLAASPIGARPSRGLVITYPQAGEYFGRTAYLQGFVEPAAAVSIEGKLSPNTDGVISLGITKDETRFAGQADNDAWEAAVTATYPGGATLTRTIALNKKLLDANPSRIDQSGQGNVTQEKLTEKVAPGQAKKIQYKGVTLDIPEGAVDKETEITIIPLTEADLGRLNPGMINVTYPDAGYRFLPHGMKFKKPIKLSFGYSKQLFAAAQTDDEVNMYFYDETLLRWVALKRTRIDAARSVVESESDHFTDIISSTLVVPEHPQALSFNPNSLKDIKAADPSANIDLIEPPKGTNMGTANLSYPIEMPKGRGAYSPDLRITYSSNNSNGWMGLGWDIPVSSIQVDTKWGVPAYDGTETYLLDGASLADMGGGLYRPRVEGQFKRIKRYGVGPAGYWWETTDKNGTRYVYGKSAARNSALRNNNAAFPAVIFQWYLEQVIDTNGNSTDFFYTNDALVHQNNGEPSTFIYLDKIYYTGNGSTLGKYHVDFVLEPSDRQDQVVNGRAGFKTVLRKRLDRVEVFFGTSLIRTYDLVYRTGDFGKSLLSAIAVKAPGKSGDLSEFYRHTLDYYSGTYGFSQPETWRTEKAQALTSSEEWSYNWSLFFGVGPCGVFHLGAGGGRGESESNTRLALMDINGDGLPDRLFEDWSLDNYNGVEINQSCNGQKTFMKTPVFNSSINALGRDETRTATRLYGVHIGGVASANKSYSRSFVEGKEAIADVNGDGFVDQVKLDGMVKVALNNKGRGFEPYRPWAGTVSADIGLTPEEIAKMKKDFHLADPVRKWIAPFGGTVRISGNVRKRQGKGTEAEDGLKAEIRRGNQLLWEQSIGADDTADYPLDVAVSSLSAGEALYFRANSLDEITNDTVTFHPVITFEQVCTPDAAGTGTTCRSVSADEAASNVAASGSRQFIYDSVSDFALFNHRAVVWQVPLDGAITLASTFTKTGSSEDLVFRVIHTRGDEQLPVPGWEDKHYSAAESGTRSDTLELADVKVGDTITFLVDNDAKITVRPDRFSWDATATYTSRCWDPDPLNSDPNERTCQVLTQEDLNKRDPDGNPLYIFSPEIHHPARLLAPVNKPVIAWVAPLDGTVVASGSVYKTAVTPSDVFVKVQGAGSQYYQAIVDRTTYDAGDPTNGTQPAPVLSPQVTIPVKAGDRLFFGIHSETEITADPDTGVFPMSWQPQVLYSASQYCYAHPDTAEQVCTPATGQTVNGSWIVSLSQVCYHAEVGGQTTTVCEPVTCTEAGCKGASGRSVTLDIPFHSADTTVNYTHVDQIDITREAFSGGYRSWYFGEWNGNEAWDTAKIKVPDREPKETDEPDEYFMASLPKRKGLPVAPMPLWWSRGLNVIISADQMNPARLGANITGMLHGLGANSLRLSQSLNEAWSASIIGQSVNASKGDAKGRQEIMDLNGDRFADIVAANMITPNTGTAAGFAASRAIDFTLGGSNDIRKIHNRNFQLGLSYPISNLEKNDTNSGGKTKKTSNTGGLSIGLVYGNSRTDVDFVDVNGDGLPDRVGKVDGAFVVRLNLGNRFGDPEYWPVPNWSQGDITPSNIPGADINSNVVASNDNIGASASFFSVNGVRQMVLLQDINGDGLPDHVMKLDGQNIKVKFNLGSSFGPETEWQTPGWGQQIGRDELKVLYGGNDTLGYSGTYSINAGFGLELTVYCVAIPVPPLCFCFNIDPGINGAVSYGESELQIVDIDGDGYPDHVLKQLTGDTSELYVKRNLAGKANLLKTVTRPLGGKFTLDYTKVGNIVDYSDQNNLIDMPNSQWVLVSTVLDDGLPGDGVSSYATTYSYGTPFYSRAEREFFGFNRVRETRNDGSVIERTFENHDYHKKGLQYVEILWDKDQPDHVWSRAENTYELRDLGAPAYQPLFPDQNYDDTHKDQLHVKFPMLKATTRQFYTGKTTDPAAPGKSTAQNFEYDDYGNISLFVDRADDGPADDVYAAITYWSDPHDNYIVGKPETIRVTDNTRSNVYRERKAVYDQGTGNLIELSMLIQGSANAVWNMEYETGTGNLAKIIYPAGDPSHNTKSDRFFISYQYDPVVQTYVTGISDAFGYSSAADYKYEFGQPNWTRDINGNYQVNEYDDFGRMVKIYGAYDTDEAGNPVCPPSLTFSYDVPVIRENSSVPVVPAGAVTVNKSASSTTCNGDTIATATFVDGMRRMVQTKKQADVLGIHGMTLSGKAVFDDLGRVHLQGQPTFEAGGNTNYTRQENTEPKIPTIFTYDQLDRTIMVQTPDSNPRASGGYAVTRTIYDFEVAPGTSSAMFKTTAIDPEGNAAGGAAGRGTKVSYKDSHDKIVAVVEYNRIDGAVNTITTTYTYDLVDQITQVRDVKGHTTDITYDLLGRRRSIMNPDTGLITYTYDANGNVTTKETANLLKGAKKINYVYAYNRLVTINYPDTTDVVYEYGAPAEAGRRQGNLAGRIKKVTDESGEEQRWYGRLGETVKELRRINAFNNPVARTWYETRYVFDSFGRMTQMTYPDGEVLAYGYDSGGLLREAYGTKRGNRYVYVKNLTYDEFGQRKRIEYGNGVTTTYAYDVRTRRLSGLLSVLPAGRTGSRTIQNIAYDYDLVGNILGTNNTAAIPAGGEHGGPTEQRFTYDDLYQLKTAGGSHQYADNKKTTYTNNFAYDLIGNITRKVQVHNVVHGTDPLTDSSTQPKDTNYILDYKYTGSQPHAVTDAGDKLYTYDLNGNMAGWTSKTSGQNRTIVWNEENRVKSITDGGTTVFLYNDAGERAVKRGQHGESVYVNRFYSVKNGDLGSKHVFAGETRVVTKLEKDGGSIQSGVPGSIALVRSQGIQNAILQGNGEKKGINRRLNPTSGGTNPPIEKFQFFYHGDHLGSSSYITDDAGAVYQHLEYFPYGETWVDDGGTGQMPYYRFTGKELDPETGLYYYGARYYDPVLSRWISADPMLVKYLPSTGSEQLAAGGVYRPINLNTYHYASNNPLLFIDPDGLWGENIHLVETEKWARAGGFSPEQANKIAEATNFVDSFWSGKNWMPVFGDQGYHFNTNAKGEDSRLERAEYHLKRAIEYQKAANKLRNKDTGFFGSIIGLFKNLLANMYEKEALKELGTGLHPLEDVDAHANEYGEQLVYKKFGIYYHNDPKNPLSRGKENRADNPKHDPERLERTEQRVSDYFQRFWNGVAGE